jgi:Response regulator containing CheY-like receiver, AAA-type ATPase, and DNA-binding domains
MMKYPWKGNVRELKNLVERLIILTDKEVIGPEDLPDYIYQDREVLLPDLRKVKTLKEFREEAEKNFILYKLKMNNWNVSKTAREIDTPRSNLYKKLEQYGIKISAGAGEAVAPSSDEEEGEESPNSTGQDGR